MDAARSEGPRKMASTPSTARISATASTAAADSIWTVTLTVPEAPARYSGTRFQRDARASAEPTPRTPCGGYRVAATAASASAAEFTMGISRFWAPRSRYCLISTVSLTGGRTITWTG